MYRNPDVVAYRAPILAGIVGILMAVSESALGSVVLTDKNPLGSFKDSIIGALMSGMRISQSRRAALEGSYHLIRTPGILTFEELRYVTHNVNELIAEFAPDLDELRFVPTFFLV